MTVKLSRGKDTGNYIISHIDQRIGTLRISVSEEVRDHWEDLDVGWWTILKWIVER
jgi:hypothetical protein